MKLALKMPSLGRVFKKTKTGVSVYLTDKVFRVLELGADRKPIFEPVELVFEHETDEEKSKVITNVIDKHKLRGKEVVTCLTADEGMLKFQKFPIAMAKKDLMEAIDWYIKSETQQIKEETIYDYYFLEKEPDDKYIRVVITIARKNSVDKLKENLKRFGLTPKIIDYEIVDIINYGLMNKLPLPFSILYIDYYEAVLTYYSKGAISYNKIEFNYKRFKEDMDTTLLDTFLIEVRNLLVINEISNVYLAGPIIADEETLENIMMNLPVLGILDLENVPPAFFIPYVLSVRGLEE
ncbi:type IV pilus assembly protein PilM [Hydrogenivirga caldilitoris]|uniref:Type IV pilus assembly protein PilM n=1 Tax=Hydrogenivirga caldilitoris TaxID=246264 RepID=A0A497XPT8_9AQUI|nr:pilus assembly protein PilM [Hydrogenivirga caldilitoris]RLJ71016.1 type IV pilus assembly protein PilM [Hydrogenivirga caldilitoris]